MYLIILLFLSHSNGNSMAIVREVKKWILNFQEGVMPRAQYDQISDIQNLL